MNFQVNNVSEISREKWANFVEKHPKGNIFQSPEMYDVYRKTKNYEPIFLAITNDAEEVLGALLIVIQKELTGLMGLFSSRAIIDGGPLIKDDDPEVLDCLLKEYIRTIKMRVIYTQFRNMWEFSDVQNEKFFINGFKFEDHLDIIHILNTTEAKLWLALKSKTRNKINKSIKNGVLIERMDLQSKHKLINSYEILKDVYHRAKIPLADRSLFEAALNVLFRKGYLQAIGAYIEDKLVGVRLFLCYKSLVYDWYAGSLSAYLSYRTNDILPWEEIKWANENGYKKFDFGGAGKPDIPYGVRDYKLKFGGELVNFGRYKLVHKKRLFEISRIGFNVLQKLKRIK
jgi:serine/alanine adding enzyme